MPTPESPQPVPTRDEIKFTMAVLPLMEPGQELTDALALLSVAALTPAPPEEI